MSRDATNYWIRDAQLGNQEATKAEAAHFAVMLKMRLFLDTFLLIMLAVLDRFALKYFEVNSQPRIFFFSF